MRKKVNVLSTLASDSVIVTGMHESLTRYSVITDKNPREIVLLRGRGCEWRRCRFCDYHLDFNLDDESNAVLNAAVLSHVTGKYNSLEVINSGSFTNLDDKTKHTIQEVCLKNGITQLRFECHWKSRTYIPAAKSYFAALGISLKIKMGVETFDALFRECYLEKGLEGSSPSDIANYADEVCLLFGLPGQTIEQMKNDIETGLSFFERVCVNIMTINSSPIKPDPRVIAAFDKNVYPLYCNNTRVDILRKNTDFGVGDIISGEKNEISE